MPSPYVVAIDPGHGGSETSDPTQLWDPGVVIGAIMEKNLTLDLAYRVRSLLQKERVKVVMTRTSDQYVEISQRWNIAHAAGARMFVSLHVNAFDGDSSINGETIFYPRPDSLPFAQAVDSALAESLKPYQIADDGVAAKPELGVHSDVPTVTVEPVYLTNSREFALMQQADFRDAIAKGVFTGMLAADPQIEATKAQIERAEAIQAAQRQADAAAAADTERTATAERWAVIIGAILLFWMLIRFARRPRQRLARSRRSSVARGGDGRVGASAMRRQYRRRRSTARRY